MTTVGIVHPGEMGATVAAACTAEEVLWCREGRSDATVERAAGLSDVDTLEELVERSSVMVSVCPPASAMAVARSIAALDFRGIYLDANAIAPATAREIATWFASFVDGGIIGPPARRAGTTRMYVSGDSAAKITDLWADSALDVRAIDGGPGAASALKLAYATWTKTSSAMLLAIRAFAVAEGVDDALLAEWAISQPGTAERSVAAAAATAPKAWRFEGEMAEIAAAMATDGLPTGFADAARAIYAQLAVFKDRADVEPTDVIDRLRP